ncbi:MAG: NAD(P)/FAD-dependent oxidoreductase [Caulobacteraceae bacterium]|nr:NAD(P)/FAD-dependent oxidoreductase [Caulobacteraceae bacterium]
MSDFDAVVVGAGAVGLACGFQLAKAGNSVLVLESANRIGSGVSSRNSEVVHAGFYYPSGSLKAKFCVEGRRAMYQFLREHSVNYEKCGKLFVATEESDIAAIEKYYKQGEINGVENARWITGAEAIALEPHLRAVAAVEYLESGVMDAHGYMDALEGEIEAMGGSVVLNSPFLGATPSAEGYDIRVGGESPTTITAKKLLISSGLNAQKCAHTIEGFPKERIPTQYLAKGNYFSLSMKAPFQRLIYPPPVPGALGTHYRRDLGGIARFGPDIEWITEENYVVDPKRGDSFYEAIRTFWPGLPDGALTADYAGIRPKIHAQNQPQPDFVLDSPNDHGMDGLICLFGIESPGLTSSLAIGAEVTKRLS